MLCVSKLICVFNTYYYCLPTASAIITLNPGTTDGEWVSITNRATGSINITVRYNGVNVATVGRWVTNSTSENLAMRFVWVNTTSAVIPTPIWIPCG